ncbi:hypothetical protein [Agrococcus sp. HG114]|uniref:hypothetical protein n=1 Tax=Agrococcus sp. HG114 TaxID=2969757 RepID=UPI00215B06F8|nr:hypothetical protein [Agrococcus sp. HG114]MCR8669865.1 hypothetical protein [Agrococcus sp. HG114]
MLRPVVVLAALAVALSGCAPGSPPPVPSGSPLALPEPGASIPPCDLDDMLGSAVGERPRADASVQWLGPDVLDEMGVLCASTVVVGGGHRESLAIAPRTPEAIAALSDALIADGLTVHPRAAAPHIETDRGRFPFVLTESLSASPDAMIMGHRAGDLMLVQYVVDTAP